jgi:hypothetical protein
MKLLKSVHFLLTIYSHTNKLLHDIFGRIDDYTEILFPQHSLQMNGLVDLINSDAIAETDYKEVELIGWLYQFYISDKKDEVFKGFKKNIKARAEDIPAATQIFTPKWIVKYMVENTVGKIYLDYEPDSDLRDQMKYLVENECHPEPVEGQVENKALINDLTQLTLIDPAAGSGHILVTGFELLFKMYREAGYNAEKAVQKILQHNLYGLDIDDRAMQLARFAVLLKAAQYDSAILEDPIMPQIYSFPEDTLGNWFTQTYYSKSQSNWHDLLGMQLAEPVTIAWEETKKGKTKTKKVTYKKGDVLNEAIVDLLKLHCNEPIAVDDAQELELFWGDKEKPWDYCELFYAINLLRQGKNLGSAIKLKISNEVYTHINDTYHNWLLKESTAQLTIEEISIFNQLKPFLDVFLVLAKQYKAVVANPPYMGSGKMNLLLKTYVNGVYPNSKGDLCTIFMDVAFNMLSKNGKYGMINQTSWMYKTTFKNLRMHIQSSYYIETMLHLGPRVFDELSGEVVQSTAFSVSKTQKGDRIGLYLDLVEPKSSELKRQMFKFLSGNYYKFDTKSLEKIPDYIVGYWITQKGLNQFSNGKPLFTFGDPKKGVATGNDEDFLRLWFEIANNRIKYDFDLEDNIEKFKWFPLNKGGGFRKWSGNFEYIIDWENDGKRLRNYKNEKGKLRSRPQNLSYSFLSGITYNIISSKGFAGRMTDYPSMMSDAGPTIYNLSNPNYILALLSSKVGMYFFKALCPGFKFDTGAVGKFPVFYVENSKVNNVVDENIEISKKDWDSRETSWDFKQSPLVNEGNTLKQAYQNWQDSVTQDFFQLHTNEEELNRIFIDIYGLQDELTPEVVLKDITILQEELISKDLEALEPTFRVKGATAVNLPINKTEVVSQFLSYAIGVFLGRYRLNKPGLNIAHPNPTEEEIATYKYNDHTVEIDDDGIVPLMGDDCAFPDDALTRSKDILLTIWGEDALTENINFLQESLGMELHKWLTEKFWGYHTSMYQKKPIYWLFSSNVKKPQQAAFKVLVYMHRMDKYTVQQIQRNYLYPHQEYIKNEINKLVQEEDNLNREQQKHLELLRDWEIECRDYNEVLKALANHQIEIDLDDGVTVNYAKFEGAVANI